MKTICVQEPFNLKVVRFELDFSSLTADDPGPVKKSKKINIPKVNFKKNKFVPLPPPVINKQKKDTKDLVEELLDELYSDQRDWSANSGVDYSRGSTSAASFASSQSNYGEQTEAIERSYLESLEYRRPLILGYSEEEKAVMGLRSQNIEELQEQATEWENRLLEAGERLAKLVRFRDRMRRKQKRLCGAFSVLLRHITGVSGARFGVTPSGGEGPGEGGYAEWHQAMRLVARLPAGVPHHFRRKLWLTLSERHLAARGVDWPAAERACFRGTAQPDDTELGAQIIKDLHRTGCSLFCGAEGRENQGMLRRVLLAYARWNKDVGYCQGFNMLAAIILEVMDKSEADSLKVMIYLVEAVLPEGYFADDLRGLSADMAAFRDLLKLRLPRLAQHMDCLQKISDGGGVEPPLPDVFTMQWFLTLYATWLPRDSLLRIWDLVLLDGNEILLLTALAIWDLLQDRILSARSADEFYSCMGGGVGAVWEAGDSLVARVVAFGSAPELPKLRSFHRYRVAPPAPPITAPVYQPPLHSAMQSMTKRGLRLFYSEDEGDSSDDGNKMAVATVIPQREDRTGTGDRLSLDIGALKRQYARLRERQRQAHVILAAACARHAAVGVPTSPTSLTVNNLLLGKSAIVSSRGRRLGPPPGAVPPSRQSRSNEKTGSRMRVRSTDTISWQEEKSRKTLSRRNSVKWKDLKNDKSLGNLRKASIDLDEEGDGTIVSEIEANRMIATLRSRSSSETSSYSSHSDSSTDTSLCDENEKGSDSDVEILEDDIKNKKRIVKDDKLPTPPNLQPSHAPRSPLLKDSKATSPSKLESIETTHSVVKDITDYLDSAAGQPLRTYIDEFDAKFNDNHSKNYNLRTELTSPLQGQGKINVYKSKLTSSPQNMSISPISPATLDSHCIGLVPPLSKSPTFKTTLYREPPCLSRSTPSPLAIEHISRIPRLTPIENRISPHGPGTPTPTEISRIPRIPQVTLSSSYTPSPLSTSEVLHRLSLSNKTDSEIRRDHIQNSIKLSPVDITPGSCDFLTNFKSPTNTTSFYTSSRPPDIIDSLTMYANFVPDIDLSDNTSPEPGSPPRSPGNDSITVSEDEPPIQLKIDKYFEHSPEFFGARVTDPNNTDIPNRRSTKRLSRIPKKPDSLTLHHNHSEKIKKEVFERASSLPQSHSFTKKLLTEDEFENDDIFKTIKSKTTTTPDNIKEIEPVSPIILQAGRKNSERALQIIQENSKILSRILTKQNTAEVGRATSASSDYISVKNTDVEKSRFCPTISEKSCESKSVESPILKESTSDSLIGCRKRNLSDGTAENHDLVRIRPISIDDPFSFESRSSFQRNEDFLKTIKSPSTDCLGNKTDGYGWVNKAFLAKCDRPLLEKTETIFNFDLKKEMSVIPSKEGYISSELQTALSPEWARHSFSGDSRTLVTLSSTECKMTPTYGRRYTSGDFQYSLSNKYSDNVLSAANDLSRKTINEGTKVSDNVIKTDDSQASEFSHNVTSSISFTYEPSVDDDSLTGAKTNSSDTLCQITSLDQVSTPISPKIFPVKDTATLPKDYLEKSDKIRFDSDDTCSAITLLDTDTLSSLSYPRSPSTGSYHPFPTRPGMRMQAKEIGVKLGMYPKDAIKSAPK